MSDENPLVAGRKDSTSGATGIGIAESAANLHNGIASGDWSEIAGGGLGTGLEALSLAMDPVGTLLQYGVSWLMEHVKPLSDALDWLAGDPDQISAYARTWKNIASSVGSVAEDFLGEVNALTGHWQGQASQAYKTAAMKQVDALKAASSAAGSVATTVEMAGALVGVVRELVRDLVAECVATLVERIPQWIAEVGGSVGIATPHVVASVSALVANWVNRIKDVILKLTRSLEKLRPLLTKLDDIWERIKKSLTGEPAGTSPASTTPAGSHPDPQKPSFDHSPDGHPTPGPVGAASAGPAGSKLPAGVGKKRISEDGGTPKDGKTPADQKNTCGDPIDVATGDMVLEQVDAQLPGILPLIFKRTHLSSYRVGRFFGETWASTVDQRLEVDDRQVCFAADDSTRLFYPHPTPGQVVLPEQGPRLPLERTEDGGYVITDPEQGLTLRFPASGAELALAAITDRHGNRIDIERDIFGVPTEIRHSGGYRIRIESAEGLITGLFLCEADGVGGDVELIRYGYEQGRLSTVVNASGLPLRFTYDQLGRITSWTDRNGSSYHYTFEAGRVVRVDGSEGFLSGSMDYDLDNRVTTWTNSLGYQTTYYLNDHGQTIREIDPLGGETVSEWDTFDRLLSRTDPLGRRIRYEYDDVGNLLAVSRPDGSQARFEYNDMRLPTTMIAPDGTVSRREYNEHGNLIRHTDPAGATTTYEYGPCGDLRTITDALGNVRGIEADSAGLPIAMTDPLGNTTRYERDGFGRVALISDPLGGVTQLGWTVDGKPAWRIVPDGATERWMYDGEGNLRTHIDALGNVTATEVTHFDVPSAEIRPDGTRLEFCYDTELRLASVTNEQGLVWRYDYDPAGNLVGETDFNGRAIAYRHDAAGGLVERINGVGEVTQYVRNALGEVAERRTSHATTTFHYDATGQLVEARDQQTRVTFQRDPCGRLVTESINGRTVSSVYDALGRRVRRVTPSGAESAWEYDPNDQPIALHSAGRTLRFGYDSAGREVRRALGSGTVLQQSWDANNQLRSQTLLGPGGKALQQRSYTYRADGFVTGVYDQLTGQRDISLDLAGRVTAVQAANWSERYAYDPAGNVTAASWPAQAGSMDADAAGDREYSGTLIRRAGAIRYEHDAQGRVVMRQRKRLSHKPETWRYFWDSGDRLTAVITPEGVRWQYLYDPLGRRVAKQRLNPDGSIAEQVEFIWDGVVLAEQAHTDGIMNGPRLGDARVTVWDYEPGTFRPIIQNERSPLRDAPRQWVDEQFYSIVTDLVGTPAEMVGDQGGIAWFHRTSLWGATADHNRTGAYTPLRFPGQYYDPETGFNYNYFRHYDPATGRYGSADPIGLLGGFNPHAYVSNPTEWIDPLALSRRGGKKKKCSEEIFERYGSQAEADSINQAGGKLTPKPSPHQNNPKWIGNQGTVDPRALGKGRNYTHHFEIHAQPGTREWMRENGFEAKPTNEPGRYAVSADKLDEFNQRVNGIVVRRRS